MLVNYLGKYHKVKKYYLSLKNTAPEAWSRYCKEVASDCGIKRNVKLIVSDAVPTPMTFGFFKPVVALPDKEFTPDELTFIITHECFHIMNKD